MKAERVQQLLNEYPQFVISYYAKKHGKIINRQGTWTKPNTDTQGKHFVSEGNDIFIFSKHSFLAFYYVWDFI